MDQRAIGVFDSGLGGLTAVRHLQNLLPNENIIYFGDTGRVPYGTRSRDTIRRYTDDDCRLLLERDVKFIIAACGTVSSVAPDLLEQLPVPAIGVVSPTAQAAAAATRNKRIGIIGTAATIRSASFEKALLAIDPTIEITATPCPLFVPLVESGWIAEAEKAVANGLFSSPTAHQVLGYKLIARHLGGEFGHEELIDRIATATWQLARRQRTWFRHQHPEAETVNMPVTALPY
jgi:glutamate racemase